MPTLSKSEKASIAIRVMSDVPSVDYATLIQDTAMKMGAETLPPEVKAFMKAFPQYKLGLQQTYIGNSTYAKYYADPNAPGLGQRIRQTLEPLTEKAEQQDRARKVLRREVDALLKTVRTHKQFVDNYPELAKYLPDTAAPKTPNLPARTDLLDKLKAAGWDKKAKKP